MKLCVSKVLPVLSALSLMSAVSAWGDAPSHGKAPPVYRAFEKSADCMRIEAGVSGPEEVGKDALRGIPRGVPRGVPRGIPRGKTSGGKKGPMNLPDRMVILAPECAGVTSEASPNLYYYVSGPWDDKIELILINAATKKEVLVTHIDGPAREGVWEIRLADHHVRLDPDTEYECFLVIVPDDAERSADFGAGATIKHVAPTEALKTRLKNLPKNESYHAYAELGFWYDAIGNLSRRIDDGDQPLRLHRAALLEQANLPVAAGFDRPEKSD